MRTLDILVIWTNPKFRIRTAYYDLAFAFHRHSDQRCYYWNTVNGPLPQRLLKIDFDLIVFNALFMSEKWSPPAFEIACQRVAALKNHNAFKVAMPQDEYVYSDICSAFINDFRIDHVCTLGPPADWPIIYAKADQSRTTFEQILPGYLEPTTMARIKPMVHAQKDRPLHIGYRAWRAEPWLGRAGQLKGQIADVFATAARRARLPVNISVDSEDAIIGDAWYKFLASCNYTIGVEGGSSVHDPDGSIRSCTETYTRQHAQASFEEVEAACFPGRDGSIQHTMITPRHLECAATGTAQILVEANYNGILKPWVHYISVRRDLSNADEALEASRDEALRRKLIDNCYRDLVVSGRYTYRHFVQDLLRRLEPRLEPRRKGKLSKATSTWARTHRELYQRSAVIVRRVWSPVSARIGWLSRGSPGEHAPRAKP